MTTVVSAESSASERYVARATYSYETNELRLYFYSTASVETAAQVARFGFKWSTDNRSYGAVARWTPERADFCLQLAGVIEVEELLLVHHKQGAMLRSPGHREAAYWAKVAERSVTVLGRKMRPRARLNRIANHEEWQRTLRNNLPKLQAELDFWSQEALSLEAVYAVLATDVRSYRLPNGKSALDAAAALKDQSLSLAELRKQRLEALLQIQHFHQRWLDHLENVLEYQCAMLVACDGVVAGGKKPEKDGACRCRIAPRNGPGPGWCNIIGVSDTSVTVMNIASLSNKRYEDVVPLNELWDVMSAARVRVLRNAGRLQEDEHQQGFFLLPPKESEE